MKLIYKEICPTPVLDFLIQNKGVKMTYIISYEELKSKSLDDLLESGKSLHEISIIYKNNEER